MSMLSRTSRTAVLAVSWLAASVWLGGIVVLGAIVAPIVFRVVHAPDSADAMTKVFLTFDKVAMAAATLIALTEAARSRLFAFARLDYARAASAFAACALAFVQGLSLSPRIADLHARGAIRGVGDLGLALEETHRWSERCGKTESLLLVAFLVLAAATSSRADGAANDPALKQ